MNCVMCPVELIGKQTKYCSKKCKGKDPTSQRNQYPQQKERAKKRKLEAILSKGGSCQNCGYNKNYSALVFHHKSGQKDFGLDSRRFSNSSIEKIKNELEKCDLLCHNCHMEHHNPQCAILSASNH